MQPQAVFRRQIHDAVVLIPSGDFTHGIEVAAIHKIAARVDFDILPREFLADPMEAGGGDHLQLSRHVGGLHFQLQEGIDAIRIDAGVLYGGVTFDAWRWAQRVAEEFNGATPLGERLLFPCYRPERAPDRPAGETIGR